MADDENRATLERSIVAMFAGDIDGATEAMADDAVVEWPQSGERIVGKQACSLVYKNYPGGSPPYELRRISGAGDMFVVEAEGQYGADTSYMTSIVEFRNGQIVKQTDYFASPFEAPAWRSQWVERMAKV
ncbi:MAG: nuclear transport factor 2 family protein [Chloroflexi bacterium]|nr:nuclear transport factor 2 family protein [Chloroflexota bacterium]